MAKNFSQQIGKKKLDELIDNKKKNIYLHPDQIIPDPSQPRRTIDLEALLNLQTSIEENEQLQPCIVHPPMDGKYMLKYGERRWRAIKQSSIVSEVWCVIDDSNDNEIDIRIKQISENKDRDSVNVYEESIAIKEIVESLTASANKAEIAKRLGIAPSSISKYILIAESCSLVKEVSINNESNDVETLYMLQRLHLAGKAELARELVNKWRAGELDTSLRRAVKAALPQKDVQVSQTTEAAGSAPQVSQSNNETGTAPLPEQIPAATGAAPQVGQTTITSTAPQVSQATEAAGSAPHSQVSQSTNETGTAPQPVQITEATGAAPQEIQTANAGTVPQVAQVKEDVGAALQTVAIEVTIEEIETFLSIYGGVPELSGLVAKLQAARG
ncbi:hypothetical protein WH50_11900 [Pokkaliibacter plantistimulans]|uniref:ParB-like N-terminal domain-containing protein n=1 Tax=Pokkaliibacter plantistimulans TaxID=1635171 RepID=A0ABX5LY40_9GAMM|nr:ParB/RepB/Spo0J family partition protein [Pokkaliibacter plantistimulans]PXF31064.1 hypothetical protein WH50_11900 [Pokkaliibacter plantistimulans]